MSRFRAGDVVVITGASSGIGRATAIEFAKRNSKIVLAARNVEKLEKVAAECRKLGADAFFVETDVKEAASVLHLRDEALKRFGRIDVWVNNAGISAIGSFTDTPLKDHVDVLQTNIVGYFNGAHSALAVFKKQDRGTLINIGSVNSHLAIPYLASYVTSKFAIRGLSHSLQQDLRLEKRDKIHVCQVNPGVTDTEAFEHSKNHSGQKLELNLPKTRPEDVARAILSVVDRPRSEKFVGFLDWLGALSYKISPTLTSLVLVWMMRKFYFGDDNKRS